MPRTYVDNAYNRSVGRAGLPVGSAVISQNTVCGMNTKTYVDNAYNRQLGREGMSHGSAVVSKYSDGLTKWNYLDTDKRGRQVCPSGSTSSCTPKCTKQTSKPCKDVKHAWRESDSACLYPQDTPRNRTKVPNSRERRRSNSSSREPSTDMDKLRKTNTFGSIRNQEIGQYKKEIKQLKKQIQELQDKLDKVRKKDIALQKQIDTNVRQCDEHLQELQELKENVLTEKDRMIAQLRNQLKERTTESSDTEQAVCILKNEIGQQEYRMKKYEKLCAEKDEELTVLRKFVIPEMETIIFQLQRQCEELSGKHGRYTLSEEELAAIQQLQNYYDKVFSRKFAITESMMHALRDKTDTVVDMLSTRKDQKDGLADFVRNYTSLIKENSSLHQTAIKQKEELNCLKRELRHSKARTHEPERKYQLERTLSEE